MEQLIKFVLSNFTLSALILSIIFAAVSLLLAHKPMHKPVVIDIFFSWFLFFNIGISYLYNFIMHVFFGGYTAAFIGWAQSPFQLEVGFASLGFAVVGIISFWSGIAFRAATVIAPSLFLWGAAGGHIYQWMVHDNLAPGNMGMVFWTDIFLPIIAFSLLWLQYRNPKSM